MRAKEESMISSTDNRRVHYRTCNLCEAMCGIEIKTEGDEIVSILGDRADTFSRGHICPKAVALKDIHTDSDRLKHPVRRTDNGWERIGWDEAFNEVAAKIKSIQERYGSNAVAIYNGNPTVHNYGSMLFGPLFLRALKTKNRFSATSVDQLPHHFASFFMFGHQLLLPIPDIERTDLFLVLGGNPVVSNGSLMTAPDVANRLKEIRKRGGRVIVVDPRRTETAEIADEHLFILPGTDVFLLLAILHTIFAENLAHPGKLEHFTDGFESIKSIAVNFSPEQVEPVTGIKADRIRKLARDFAGAEKAVCYGRIGVSTQQFGAANQWLINVLNIITGNLDRPGGAMFTRPAFDIVGLTALMGQKGHYGKWKSRVRNLPEFGGELPVAALAEEILTEGDGQIRALVTSAGNPVLSTPNGRQLDRAMEKLEFMVSIDFYINETTRHAHIILPPTSSLEHENYDLIFHVLAIRNTAKFSPALFKPEPDTRHDWEIFLELMLRLEGGKLGGKELARVKRWLLRRVGPEIVLDWGLRFGPYGVKLGHSPHRLSLRKLKQEVSGIDLCPMEPSLPERLFTKSKRIDLAPEVLMKDVERIQERFSALAMQQKGGFDLLLIGRRQLRSNNSWMHNYERLVKGKDRCTLLMHPEDAVRRGIQSGQNVRVSSRVGSVEAKVEVTETLMQGVVSLPHGWGHNRSGIKIETAQKFAGVSINDLTDDAALDALSGNAALCGTPVSVEGAGL
jgi:anaerobic selenocysteine-containing dehydrogenase